MSIAALIAEYTAGIRELNRCKKRLDRNDPKQLAEIRTVSGMLADMRYALEWMRRGAAAGEPAGRRAARHLPPPGAARVDGAAHGGGAAQAARLHGRHDRARADVLAAAHGPGMHVRRDRRTARAVETDGETVRRAGAEEGPGCARADG